MNIHINENLVVFKFALLMENSCFNVGFNSCSSVIEARNLEAKDANGMFSTYLYIITIVFIFAYLIILQYYLAMVCFVHAYISSFLHNFFLLLKLFV